jgi:hypothetical protein
MSNVDPTVENYFKKNQLPGGWQQDGRIAFPDGRLWNGTQDGPVTDIVHQSYLWGSRLSDSLGVTILYDRRHSDPVDQAFEAIEAAGKPIDRFNDGNLGYIFIPESVDIRSALNPFVQTGALSKQDYKLNTGTDYQELPAAQRQSVPTPTL